MGRWRRTGPAEDFLAERMLPSEDCPSSWSSVDGSKNTVWGREVQRRSFVVLCF
jgi:hypothetical protein